MVTRLTSAHAIVNCRILPGHSALEVQQTLATVVDDTQVQLQYVKPDGSTADRAPSAKTPLTVAVPPRLFRAIAEVSQEMWPGVPVLPTMIAGASDSTRTNAAGIPTFGVSGVLLDSNDIRAQGSNERVRTEAFYRGNEFFYRLVKAITSEATE